MSCLWCAQPLRCAHGVITQCSAFRGVTEGWCTCILHFRSLQEWRILSMSHMCKHAHRPYNSSVQWTAGLLHAGLEHSEDSAQVWTLHMHARRSDLWWSLKVGTSELVQSGLWPPGRGFLAVGQHQTPSGMHVSWCGLHQPHPPRDTPEGP